MTPDELAYKIAAHLLTIEGTGPAWGLELLDAKSGYAKVAMRLRPDMLNGHQTAHGGMIFALADTAFAYACNSRNIATVAQHASISFLAPGRVGERLIAEAQELSLRGRSGVYRVSICNENGTTIAEFQGLSRAVGGAVLPELDT